jgi:hypothetical protein
MVDRDGHVVFKCTYHDGGHPTKKNITNFYKLCSIGNIKKNIDSGRVWCNQDRCPCKQYYKNGFNGTAPNDFPCYESRLSKDLGFGPGTHQRGKRAGKPIKIHGLKVGAITFLTTKIEKDWYLFGMVPIESITSDKIGSTWVQGDKERAVILPEQEWIEFWESEPLGDTVEWQSGLFRHVKHQGAFNMLVKFYNRLKSPHDRNIIEKEIKKISVTANIDWPISDTQKFDKNAEKKKYGPGGEGPDHKKIKNAVYDKPQLIGLKGIRKKYIEYSYSTGDRVDIAFELKNGEWVTVEVEVEGEQNNYCGLLQAVKYRSLMEVQKEKKMGTGVSTFLVAYDIPKPIQDLANKYSVKCVELPKLRE